VFTARYALSPYIKQIRFVFKWLMYCSKFRNFCPKWRRMIGFLKFFDKCIKDCPTGSFFPIPDSKVFVPYSRFLCFNTMTHTEKPVLQRCHFVFLNYVLSVAPLPVAVRTSTKHFDWFSKHSSLFKIYCACVFVCL
jgi:hypothetical protein